MNCLKCGKTVPDATLLCPECCRPRRAVARPKLLPTQEEVQQRQLARLRRQRSALRRWLVLFLLLTLAAAAVIGYGWRYTQQQSRQIASQTSRINSLDTAISDLQTELEQASALNDALRDALTQDQQTIDAYQQLTGLTPDELEAPPTVP